MPKRKHYRWLSASSSQRRRLQAIERGKGLLKKTVGATPVYLIREGGRVDPKMVSALISKGYLVEQDDGSYRVSVL